MYTEKKDWSIVPKTLHLNGYIMWSFCVIACTTVYTMKAAAIREIFQRFFCFLHCTDEYQKSKIIVCSWKNNENHYKLTLNFKK